MRLDSKPRLLAAAEFRGTLHCFRRIMHCSSYSTCALSALTYAIMAPYIAFTTYLCLIYGVKFSPTQAALWITSTGWATLIELFIQEPLLILSSTVVKNFSLGVRLRGRPFTSEYLVLYSEWSTAEKFASQEYLVLYGYSEVVDHSPRNTSFCTLASTCRQGLVLPRGNEYLVVLECPRLGPSDTRPPWSGPWWNGVRPCARRGATLRAI